MKKIFLPLIFVLAVMIFTGCGRTESNPVDSNQSLMAPPSSNQTTASQAGTASASGTQLSIDSAEAIALSHAGFTADQVTYIYSWLDRDDGRYEYDVEFHADGFEFDYEINSQTGEIISFDKEKLRTAPTENTTAVNSSAQQGITEDAAAAIALTHAGYTADSVSRLQVEYDRDNGRYEYEIEFYADGYEFDYEIDASTGDIISHHKELDD